MITVRNSLILEHAGNKHWNPVSLSLSLPLSLSLSTSLSLFSMSLLNLASTQDRPAMMMIGSSVIPNQHRPKIDLLLDLHQWPRKVLPMNDDGLLPPWLCIFHQRRHSDCPVLFCEQTLSYCSPHMTELSLDHDALTLKQPTDACSSKSRIRFCTFCKALHWLTL